jgi:hypothetical protein
MSFAQNHASKIAAVAVAVLMAGGINGAIVGGFEYSAREGAEVIASQQAARAANVARVTLPSVTVTATRERA